MRTRNSGPKAQSKAVQVNTGDDLEKIYTNVKSQPAYSAKINEFLSKNKTQSKHGRIIKRQFPRRRIIVNHPTQIFMADLIEYTRSSKMKFANRNHVYILVVIDCFSKFVWVKPLKKKNKTITSKAFAEIFDELDNYPNTIITDEGKEFYNSDVRKLFDSYQIHHYSIKTRTKASMAERVIRTLKSRIEKYMSENNTRQWIDVLPDIVHGYNHTPHRSTGIAPGEINDDNISEVFKKLYPDLDLLSEPRLKIGNIVRVLRKKSLFDKGYKQNWSSDVFKIRSVRQKAGVVWYKLTHLNNKSISGSHYYYELRKVAEDIESYDSK